jgi:Lysophospholipase L1 and related esterases
MVVCFIGDSLTQGIGDQKALGWVGRLAQASFVQDPARPRHLTVYNLGLRGESSVAIRERWRGDTDRRRRNGEDMAFVFSFGAADGLHKVPHEDTLIASREILETAASLGRTLYVSPPPAFDPAWSAHIKNVGGVLRGICAGADIPTFDFHAPLAADAAYMASLEADGIHPDTAGYDRMAALLRCWAPMVELMQL